VKWPFQIEGVDRHGHAFWANGVLQDISARGSSGYCFDPPELGTRVMVSIKVPFKGERYIRYLAEIIRVEEGQSRTFIALKFESTRPIFYTQDAKNNAVLNKPDDTKARLVSEMIFTA
jgi:hypothetical protein